MGYQISFEGVASTELSHMLRAVERGVNWNGMHLRVQGGDGGYQTAAASVVSLCPGGKPCVENPHGPHSIIIGLVILGAFSVGGLIGFGLGQSVRVKDLANLQSRSGSSK